MLNLCYATLFNYSGWLVSLQEKALAIAENRSPVLYSGDDVRPLNMSDFKYAQEQVICPFCFD